MGARVGGEIDRTVDYAGLEKATGSRPATYGRHLFPRLHVPRVVTGRPHLPVKDSGPGCSGSGSNRASCGRRPPSAAGLSLWSHGANDPALRFPVLIRRRDPRGPAGSPGVPRPGGGWAENGVRGRGQHSSNTCSGKAQGPQVQGAYFDQCQSSPGPVPAAAVPALIVDCATGDRTGLGRSKRSCREADLKRLDCAGLLSCPETRHWAESLEQFPSRPRNAGRDEADLPETRRPRPARGRTRTGGRVTHAGRPESLPSRASSIFMSSHTSFFFSGLRPSSRAAGWNVHRTGMPWYS